MWPGRGDENAYPEKYILSFWCCIVVFRSRWTVYVCYSLKLYPILTMVAATIYSISHAIQNMTLMFLFRRDWDLCALSSSLGMLLTPLLQTNNAVKLMLPDFGSLVRKKWDNFSLIPWNACTGALAYCVVGSLTALRPTSCEGLQSSPYIETV